MKINSRVSLEQVASFFLALNTAPSLFHMCICEPQDELEAPFRPHVQGNWILKIFHEPHGLVFFLPHCYDKGNLREKGIMISVISWLMAGTRSS